MLVFRAVILLMAEILHQLIGSFSPHLQGFIHRRWCRSSAINSTSPKNHKKFDDVPNFQPVISIVFPRTVGLPKFRDPGVSGPHFVA